MPSPRFSAGERPMSAVRLPSQYGSRVWCDFAGCQRSSTTGQVFVVHHRAYLEVLGWVRYGVVGPRERLVTSKSGGDACVEHAKRVHAAVAEYALVKEERRVKREEVRSRREVRRVKRETLWVLRTCQAPSGRGLPCGTCVPCSERREGLRSTAVLDVVKYECDVDEEKL